MFIQCTDELPPISAVLDLELTLPDRKVVSLRGQVTWQRPAPDASGPRGVGIEFDEPPEGLGGIVDDLVLGYSKISIVALCQESPDRKTLQRMLKSIIGTADVCFAGSHQAASNMINTETDLVLIDADLSKEAAIATLRVASELAIPTIAMTDSATLGEALKSAGAGEVLPNLPSSSKLRRSVLQLLASPSHIASD